MIHSVFTKPFIFTQKKILHTYPLQNLSGTRNFCSLQPAIGSSLHQQSHHLQMPLVGGPVQGRRSTRPRPRVHISTALKPELWIRIQSGQWIRIRNPDPDPDPGGQK
jgi:hypothetical protein